MAFLAVTSLMQTIDLQFLQPQPRVILENKQQIESLHEKLGHLLNFLDESEEKSNSSITCAEMKEVVERIRRVTLKAELDIEAKLLKLHHYHALESTLQRVARDIDELLMQSSKSTSNRLVKNLTADVTRLVSNPEDHSMVGHSEELERVINQLLPNAQKKRQVIAIVGMGGIGKTTFVKELYEHPQIKKNFDLRGWTTMSQDYIKEQVLLDLCRCIMPRSATFNIKMEGELGSQLKKSLRGQRYLIVLDDIWTTQAWDYFQLCFPDDKNGSRILLTTRDREVAKCDTSGKHTYDMRFLNTNEGWVLFRQKLFEKECLNNKEFETIGRNIVQKCQGLPLTIVVLAGLLSSKPLDEWKNVESTINSLVSLDPYQKFSKILDLSYNNLPSHLKGCFLYLGVFHEDCEIPVKKLIRLWIAEGLVNRTSNSPEETGGEYLQDLINRSLVMVNGLSFGGKIKTCRMHDLLHDLCVSKAKQNDLLFLESTGSSDRFQHCIEINDTRWLSLKVVIPAFHLVVLSRSCRSILCFNMVVNCDREWYLLTNSFKNLRVLDLSKIKFPRGRLPRDIVDLVFLRYLALASTKLLNHIPLRKNWNLQTLIIGEDDNGACRLPQGIWVLPQLMHLEIYHQVPIEIPDIVLENLQTLYWLSASRCLAEVFSRIPNVKELGVISSSSSSSNGLNMCCLTQLEKLKVQGSYNPLHLPREDIDIFPRNLKNLTLVKTFIPWEEMSIVSKLPHLEVLKLRNFACVGPEWRMEEEGGFRQLKVLLISITDLKEWEAEVESPLPKLKHLLLRNCFELLELPEWVGEIYSLESVKLEYCYNSLVCSAEGIKKEQSDYNHYFEVLHSNTRPDEDHIEIEDEGDHHHLSSLWFDARQLRIVWGDDPRYWIWTRESGYEVAVLKKVSWLEIRVTFNVRCLSTMSLYSAYLVFKLESAGQFREVETALTGVRYEKDKAIYGWMRGENRHSQVFIAKSKSDRDCGRFPESRCDGWMEIKLGEFYVSSGNEGEVELQLYHTSDQWWMSGLVVRGIEVRSN